MEKLKGILILCFVLVGSIVYGNDQSSFKESRIGGFDFTAGLMKERQLIKLLGKGCVDKDYPYHYRRVYYFPDKNIYGAFNIETANLVPGLELTKEAIVSKQCKAKKSLKKYTTGRGLALADKVEKVVSLYGKPSQETRKNNVLIYDYYVGNEEGPFMTIKIQNDRVISMYITVGD